jgi:eukaryotic-like serine/threonine-protein kinase
MNSHPRKNSDSVDLSPGDRVGAYRIERDLGSGGMAVVYYAIHLGLERPAALKILRPSLATDEVHLQRFLQEARAAASLVHPNIVQVYDVGQDGELRYIAQEYIPGTNLRHYLAHSEDDVERPVEPGLEKPDRQLKIGETLSILLQILAALNKSATSGIVHRDIKPENIMLTPEGDVKVADFGLARLLLGDDPQLTRAGTTLGTPMYMSPEQIQEGEVDIRSDLYSLGVTLYHMLCGRPPFSGETPLALAMQHVQATVPDLTQFREDVPESLVQLVDRLLAKSPGDRFANPQEILEYLRMHRSQDLVEHWPDQTIPLPGAAVAGFMGPTRATLMLQAQLRTNKRARVRALLNVVGAAAITFVAFVIGNTYTFSSSSRLLGENPGRAPGIERKETVQEQYRWALFESNATDIDQWQAVERYFPPNDNTTRFYVGLANLQLARVFRERGDTARARDSLSRIRSDANMPNVIKAFAFLEIAGIEDTAADAPKVQAALQQAKMIRNDSKFNAKDSALLDAAARRLSTELQMLWFTE